MKLLVTQSVKLTVEDLRQLLAKQLGLPEKTTLSVDHVWVGGYGGDDVKSFSGITLTFEKETELP